MDIPYSIALNRWSAILFRVQDRLLTLVFRLWHALQAHCVRLRLRAACDLGGESESLPSYPSAVLALGNTDRSIVVAILLVQNLLGQTQGTVDMAQEVISIASKTAKRPKNGHI